MPGVPPDTLDQVKKGLKGLFSRKRRNKSQLESDASTFSSAAEASQGRAAAMHHDTPASQPTENRSTIPQISEPANVEESKNIDLDPSSPYNRGILPTGNASTQPPVASSELSSAQSILPKLEPKVPAEGMSATSGPLSDELGYAGSLGSPTEEKKLQLPMEEGNQESGVEAEDTEVSETARTVETFGHVEPTEDKDINKALLTESHE
ncbi:hypothetical protein MMC13_006519 [Lambiella insularis]|nr:hypothetical protein [Lambiella insularis]